MKKIIAILAAAALLLSPVGADARAKKSDKASKAEVTFVTTMDCEKCAVKVRENLSFEKGVLGLDIKLAEKTVKIVYNPKKTDVETLGKAIRKLGYEAEVKK